MVFNSVQLNRKMRRVQIAFGRYENFLADRAHLSPEELALFFVQIQQLAWHVEMAIEDYRAYARSICEEEIH